MDAYADDIELTALMTKIQVTSGQDKDARYAPDVAVGT